MKKSLIMTIIIFLLVGVLGGVVNAASASARPSASSVEIGNNVTVTISFGQKVSAAKFTLNYDTSKLEYVSYSCGGSGLKEFGTGTKRFGYVGTADDLSSVSFTFKTKAVGTASVSAKSVQVSTGSQTNVAAGSPSTSITIKEKPQPTTPNNPTTPSTNNKPSTTTKPSTKPSTNKNNNKNNNKKDETPVEEPVQEPIEEPVQEPVVQAPAPNELLKLDDETVKTLIDEPTKVMIKAKPIAFEDGTKLNVKRIKDGDEAYQARNDMFKDIEGIKTYFDLKLLKIVETKQDGQMVQSEQAVTPNGYVTVFLPIPENYNKERLVAYKMNEDGTYKVIEGQIQENYYTFTTNSPTNYALVETPEKKTWGQTAMEKVNEVLGNVKILHISIIVLLCIILIETITIIRLSRQKAKRSK